MYVVGEQLYVAAHLQITWCFGAELGDVVADSIV
ncbi:hypothetical protein P305_02465 [Xylella fastidiosa subsp. fastidiosa Mus-1]|nr:hypothetical protein P305_02465 [Xylella fastidiosa subsp. fastidiosa Mus-1]